MSGNTTDPNASLLPRPAVPWRHLAAYGVLAAAACLQLLLGSSAHAKSPEWDMLITNARIVDGTGSPWYRGAVAIKDGRIAWVGTGTPDTANATRLIDAGVVGISSPRSG